MLEERFSLEVVSFSLYFYGGISFSCCHLSVLSVHSIFNIVSDDDKRSEEKMRQKTESKKKSLVSFYISLLLYDHLEISYSQKRDIFRF